ncbi:hypothetical protein [Reticulibacter mediterranei]|uniref:hypothetical protein n=1 Tax=Reticulibacter mediterranei TaxID=2778369 RepID=UPI001F1E9F23|nr:hypothetical protein [Reticulibacter mediterranei]
MKAYSEDLLERILRVVDLGCPEPRLRSSSAFLSRLSSAISNNDVKKDMYGPKRFLVAHRTALRRAGARTREALEKAIGQALLIITAQDAQGWFQHCGYLLTRERKS